MRARLEAAAATLGVAIDDAGWDRLAQLVALWKRYARAVNLVGASTDDALARHIEEAFVTVACADRAVGLNADRRWLDVGSGGGFPALVAAAVAPCAFHLVEPRQKRAAFLELALSTIGRISPVSRARIGDSTWNENGVESEIDRFKMGYTIVTSRATFAPDRWLAIGEKLVMSGGVLIAHVPKDCARIAARAADVRVEGPDSAALGFRVAHELDGDESPRG
jgi:16S rRNA (guanine527-N7)-methyltransferase